MKKRLNRLLTLLVIMMMTTGVAMAQSEEQPAPLNLKVTVNVEEAGTLFVKIMEQIEEIGELSDVGELTVTGPLNVDDYNVLRNQMTNMTLLDLSATTVERRHFAVQLGLQAAPLSAATYGHYYRRQVLWELRFTTQRGATRSTDGYPVQLFL